MITAPDKHALTHDLQWEGTCSCDGRHTYRIQTSKGFTDSFTGKDVRVLIDLGLVVHKEDGYDLVNGSGQGIGPLVRRYGP